MDIWYHSIGDRTAGRLNFLQGSSDGSSTALADSDDRYTIRTGSFIENSKTKTSVIAVNSMEVTDSGDYTCRWTTTRYSPEATMAVAIRCEFDQKLMINQCRRRKGVVAISFET